MAVGSAAPLVIYEFLKPVRGACAPTNFLLADFSSLTNLSVFYGHKTHAYIFIFLRLFKNVTEKKTIN